MHISNEIIDKEPAHNKRWNYERLINNLIFTTVLVGILIIAVMSNEQFNRLIGSNKLIAKSYKLIGTAHDIQYQLAVLELDGRNYLLDNDESYVANFKANSINIKKTLQEIVSLSRYDSLHIEIAQQLAKDVNERLVILDKFMQLKMSGTIVPSDISNILQNNQNLTDEINFKISEIIALEDKNLREIYNNTIKNTNDITLFYNISISIFISLLIITFALFRREAHKKELIRLDLQNTALMMESIIEGANDKIAAVDTNNCYIYFNQAYQREFKRLFNHDIKFGSSIDAILTGLPTEKQTLFKAWKELFFEKNELRNVEFTADNQRIVYEVRASLLINKNKHIIGTLYVIRNITERVRESDYLKESCKEMNIGMQEILDKNEKISLLLEMSDVLQAADNIQELSNITAKYCASILSFSSGLLYIMHSSKNHLEASARWGNPVSKDSDFSVEACWALRLGHIYQGKSLDSELICEHVKASDTNSYSYICIPLRAKNDVFGLLYIEMEIDSRKSNEIINNERLLVNALTELIALALANIRLRETLQYQSLRDPLTSLYNRRYLEEYLSKLIDQSNRSKISMAVLMIDADHFKKVNDIYGHDVGDIVLKELAQVFLKNIRSGDIASRYGGEEFIVVLYDVDTDTAKACAEKLKHDASLISVKYGAQHTGGITISIGVAVYPADGKTSKELIEQADKALYFAKNTGRDKVVLSMDISKDASSFNETLL